MVEMYFPASDTHFTNRDIKSYQRVIYDAALHFCKQRRCAVDIGAHVGIFTRRMEADFASVVAFEPQEENFFCLSKNCPRATKINRAVSDTFTVGTMTTPKLSNSGAWEFKLGGNLQAVPLDSFELDDVDLIKIDVQGWEKAVLNGAKETLARCKPVLIVENPDVEQLQELGYAMGCFLDKDFVFVHGGAR